MEVQSSIPISWIENETESRILGSGKMTLQCPQPVSARAVRGRDSRDLERLSIFSSLWVRDAMYTLAWIELDTRVDINVECVGNRHKRLGSPLVHPFRGVITTG